MRALFWRGHGRGPFCEREPPGCLQHLVSSCLALALPRRGSPCACVADGEVGGGLGDGTIPRRRVASRPALTRSGMGA